MRLSSRLRHIRQYSVVVDVIPIVTRLSRDNQLLQPLDTATTDLPRYHSSQRFAMVRSQHLAVHLVCQHDATVRVHNPVELHRSTIVTVGLCILLDTISNFLE
jgi:hypothetical protein